MAAASCGSAIDRPHDVCHPSRMKNALADRAQGWPGKPGNPWLINVFPPGKRNESRQANETIPRAKSSIGRSVSASDRDAACLPSFVSAIESCRLFNRLLRLLTSCGGEQPDLVLQIRHVAQGCSGCSRIFLRLSMQTLNCGRNAPLREWCPSKLLTLESMDIFRFQARKVKDAHVVQHVDLFF